MTVIHLFIALICIIGCIFASNISLSNINELKVEGIIIGLMSGLFYTILGKGVVKKGYG